MADYMEFERERRAYQNLRAMVDGFAEEIAKKGVSDPAEVERTIASARRYCERNLPDKLELFEMVYASRLRRLARRFGTLNGP